MIGYAKKNTALRLALLFDPTHTLTLRNQFAAQMGNRWQPVKRDVKLTIVDNDAFGIQPERLHIGALAAAPPRSFVFGSSERRVVRFMEWLETQEDFGVLELIRRPGVGGPTPWSNIWIDSGYQQGMRRGREELIRAGYAVPSFEGVPGGVGAAFNQPIHADRVAALYTRTFENLKSVVAATNAATRTTVADALAGGLARGLAEGKNPLVVARELSRDVVNGLDKIGRARMRMIARTEMIRAHNEGLFAEYQQLSTELMIEIKAEILTAGDDRVCLQCLDLESGGPYKLEVARMLLPAHPLCRCMALPVRAEAHQILLAA